MAALVARRGRQMIVHECDPVTLGPPGTRAWTRGADDRCAGPIGCDRVDHGSRRRRGRRPCWGTTTSGIVAGRRRRRGHGDGHSRRRTRRSWARAISVTAFTTAQADLAFVGVLKVMAARRRWPSSLLAGSGLSVRTSRVVHALVVIGPVQARLPEGFLHQLRLGLDVEAGEGHAHVLSEAPDLVHGDLQGGGRRLAPGAADTDPVGADLLERDGVETGPSRRARSTPGQPIS